MPLCFKAGEDADTLGLTGHERYTIDLPENISEIRPGQDVTVRTETGKSFTCTVRFDTEVRLTLSVSFVFSSYILAFLCVKDVAVAIGLHDKDAAFFTVFEFLLPLYKSLPRVLKERRRTKGK